MTTREAAREAARKYYAKVNEIDEKFCAATAAAKRERDDAMREARKQYEDSLPKVDTLA